MMIDPYKPIACALHDEYEIAIMHGKCLNIRWSDEGGEHAVKVLPTDILVQDKQEFLVAKTQDDQELCLRLDRIVLLRDDARG